MSLSNSRLRSAKPRQCLPPTFPKFGGSRAFLTAAARVLLVLRLIVLRARKRHGFLLPCGCAALVRGGWAVSFAVTVPKRKTRRMAGLVVASVNR